MNNNQDLFPEEDKNSFEAAFAWWEKRRLRYNLIVGLPGLLFLLIHYRVMGFHLSTIISAVVIGIIANGFYCLGYLTEFFLKYYFHSTIDFADKRNTVFWLGTVFSIFALLLLGFVAEVTN
jgi:hypothetical protein